MYFVPSEYSYTAVYDSKEQYLLQAPFRRAYEYTDHISKRNRTFLHNKCWFSKLYSHLTVEECIAQHPSYMRWIRDTLLTINWSVYVRHQLEYLGGLP